MPFFPVTDECEDKMPSLCGNKITPYFSDLCSGCMPRPHGDCLDELLIPDICEESCPTIQHIRYD